MNELVSVYLITKNRVGFLKKAVDSVLNQTVTSTTATILGLSSNTTYDIQVRAKDGAGNESGFSNLLQVRTL